LNFTKVPFDLSDAGTINLIFVGRGGSVSVLLRDQAINFLFALIRAEERDQVLAGIHECWVINSPSYC